MKRVSFLIVIAAALTVVLLGCSKGHESTKSAGDLTITLSVARYPLVKSDNTLTVKVTDAAGAAVTDGAVNVRYYMPPMPGMFDALNPAPRWRAMSALEGGIPSMPDRSGA